MTPDIQPPGTLAASETSNASLAIVDRLPMLTKIITTTTTAMAANKTETNMKQQLGLFNHVVFQDSVLLKEIVQTLATENDKR